MFLPDVGLSELGKVSRIVSVEFREKCLATGVEGKERVENVEEVGTEVYGASLVWVFIRHISSGAICSPSVFKTDKGQVNAIEALKRGIIADRSLNISD